MRYRSSVAICGVGIVRLLRTSRIGVQFGQPGRTEGEPAMKEPGLDGRHRDKARPKAGEIQQKRSDTLNKNLPRPIFGFSPNATLGHMRKVTGKVSESAVRKAAAKRSK